MDSAPALTRALYCGDNLHILANSLTAESVDLIYLDPPFYSQRNYQAFFKPTPLHAQSRSPAFGDTWRWHTEAEQVYSSLCTRAPTPVIHALSTLRELLGTGPLLAYLVMMTERLIELHRVLKPTGSLYLHCDPAAGHYLKLLLDVIFGATNFRNEIVWCYKTGGASSRHFARKHDLLFFYTKSEHYSFHALKEKSYMMHHYGFKKSEFLHDERGDYTWVYMKDVWELPALGAADGQRLGYPTQKPEALLERIIRASSNEGDLILDPFCGSGTTLAVAQRLGRGWIGIESDYLAIAYQRYRLATSFPNLHYTCSGAPTTFVEARQLARTDATRFRWWALSLVCARPLSGKRLASTETIYGLLPSRSAESLPHFVLVTGERLDLSILPRLHLLIKNLAVTRILLLALEAPEPQTLAELRNEFPGDENLSIEVRTIAEICQFSDGKLSMHEL